MGYMTVMKDTKEQVLLKEEMGNKKKLILTSEFSNNERPTNESLN